MPEFYEKLCKVGKAAQYGHKATLNPQWVESAR